MALTFQLQPWNIIASNLPIWFIFHSNNWDDYTLRDRKLCFPNCFGMVKGIKWEMLKLDLLVKKRVD